jgi:hypothetical protein
MTLFYYAAVLVPTCVGLAFALAEMFSPRWFLRRRAEVLAKRGKFSAEVARGTERALGLRDSEPWDDPISVRRLRVFGLILFIVIAMEAVVFLWLVPRAAF